MAVHKTAAELVALYGKPRKTMTKTKGPKCRCGEPLFIHTDYNGNVVEECPKCGTRSVRRWIPDDQDPPEWRREGDNERRRR